MSVSINAAFVKQFEEQVHESYQRLGSKLLKTVRTISDVRGSTAVFQKIGKGSAATKSTHGMVPVMNIAHTSVECALVDFYAGDWVDKFDELRINHDERTVIANAGAYALGRKTDDLILSALSGATANVITDGNIGMTKDKVLQAFKILDANEVPDDDEAIEFGILSDQINAIRGLVSSRHLQVFCSGAEFMVTGDPLTPTNIQVKRQTRIGSPTDRTIPPIDIDGATMFINRTRNEIREFLYTDLEQAYRATDVALLTRDMIAGAVDQDFDKTRRLLVIVRADGTFSTLTLYRSENINAWSRHQTNGTIKSCATAGNKIYFQVLRNGNHVLEEWRDDLFLDSCVIASNPTAQVTWSGLSHLNGMTVSIMGDGLAQESRTVSGGTVMIQTAAQDVVIGLCYAHKIDPLPINNTRAPLMSKKCRLVSLNLKLQETGSLKIDTGKELRSVPLPNTPPPENFSGDITITGYGWHDHTTSSLWNIHDDTPYPFKLLSITTQTQVN